MLDKVTLYHTDRDRCLYAHLVQNINSYERVLGAAHYHTVLISRRCYSMLVKFYVFQNFTISVVLVKARPPLWSSGQSFWPQIQRSRVRSPALPDFLSSSGSGTGFTQPREVN